LKSFDPIISENELKVPEALVPRMSYTEAQFKCNEAIEIVSNLTVWFGGFG
jgi:hypothetical protein